MKKIKPFSWLLSLTLAFIGCSLGVMAGEYIEQDKLRWKPYFLEVKPDHPVTNWLLPFKTSDRRNPKTFRVISTYGADRQSFLKGHIHAGIDMIPAPRAAGYTYVYPMAEGIVCSIHLGHPHQTIVVAHQLPGGEILYSSYKHFQEIYVANGQKVTPETKLARLYTRQEALLQGGNYDHLHLEIRKKFDDYGVASWATLTQSDLNLRFLNPWEFIKSHVR